MPERNDLVDPDDFCRQCGGRGGHTDREPLPGNPDRTVWSPCYSCRGTGKRTVRVE